MGDVITGAFQSYTVNSKEELEQAEKEIFALKFTSKIRISIYCIEEDKCHFYKTQRVGEGEYILLEDGNF